MTVSQLNKRKFPKIFFILGLIPMALGIVFVISLYNTTVDADHKIISYRTELEQIEAHKAELGDRLITLFARNNIETFVREHGLREDRNPRYILVQKNTTWEVASQY